MAFSAAFSHTSFIYSSSFSQTRKNRINYSPFVIKAENSSSEPQENNEKPKSQAAAAATTSSSTTATATKPKKPVYSMKKGQIVRVEKEKYLNSINYLSVDHPPYYKGLDYIYEDRGEVLDIRIFETGEYALIGWIGIPTAPAWLPTEMLIKSDKLDYERI
ncbi:NAD(P)H-quinone oxidoreductase subunit O, chloroplastic isoform X1 [Solanum pennellii]|uniref:NAD(P)H-quinone oxidoreductase subunit O, chloroplastic isoform X1 n=1 Tax=Solanum pennellii TaxID=28526 RepID=A0ABM1FLQ5_SOLPN|nr:NAD(P)H-quinone oxidoreductase subunit O, chloroplastic isoform X2 [Solanum pennellii]XP_015058718.1 NAD(P)H-quinone oxidoreductase subunit O, chloroplastic isoform X1 [Solanum pennellii]